MTNPFSAKTILFVYVKGHLQLQYYFDLRETSMAANDGHANDAVVLSVRPRTEVPRWRGRRGQ